jgi:glycosyltransferase involved in cell wall biosynthesis
MRLLIVTQVVDRTHPILGFFHRWLEEFALHCEEVTVLAQRTGEYQLPLNVHVHSLGKERGVPRAVQVLRFWNLQWTLRRHYDVVLVHMTPIWIVLGCPLWFLLRKPMYLWYEARGTRLPLRIALRCVRKAFSASPYGMPVQTPKSVVVGHGIDTDFFRFGMENRDMHLLATVGRITRAKRLDLIVQSFATLPADYRLRIIGVPLIPSDTATLSELRELVADLGLTDRIEFRAMLDDELRSTLQKANVFLHASMRTGLDKAALEAMACGALVISTNPGVRAFLPEVLRADDGSMPRVLAAVLALPREEQDRLRRQERETVEREHALPQLVRRLTSGMSGA